MAKFGIDKEERIENRKRDQQPTTVEEFQTKQKKNTGIHYQERGDDIVFHIGSKGERQTIPKQQFLQQFPKQPYHGIKDPKWAEYLDKNDKACAAFIKKYG